ncbi:MAG TPA: hypothetical protein VLJ76_11760 [Gaiellaceae bacterium]|nr:hypothetical protein [Gaiellaceae bacterium]
MGRSFAGGVLRLAAAALLVLAALGASSALPAGGVQTRVTIFGDSAAEVLDYVPDAKASLGQGLSVNWQLRVCRRLVQLSCPYQGVRPPTVMDVVQQSSPASLGSIVVVDVGYNEYVQQFQNDMETVVKALVAKGVTHIIWPTLHEVRQDYRTMNVAIRAEAAKWPQVTIVDWNAVSQGQDWFNSDGIHLDSAGAWGLAKLLRPAILAACGDPCSPPPPAPPGRSYVIRFAAATIRVGAYTVLRPPARGTYAQATSAFGRASTCRVLPGKKSRAIWPTLGLTMQFIVTPGSICSTPGGMLLQTISMTGARWKTSDGLSVGDPVSKLQRLYPSAAAGAGSDSLVEVDRGSDHAMLSAVVRNGVVAGFSLAVRSG